MKYVTTEQIKFQSLKVGSQWISKEDYEKEINDWKWKFTEKCIEIENLEQEIKELIKLNKNMKRLNDALTSFYEENK